MFDLIFLSTGTPQSTELYVFHFGTIFRAKSVSGFKHKALMIFSLNQNILSTSLGYPINSFKDSKKTYFEPDGLEGKGGLQLRDGSNLLSTKF